MRKLVRRTVQWSVLVAGIAVLVWQLPTLAREAGGLRNALAGLRWEWIAVAALLGVGSMVAYGELHRRLLIAGGVHIRLRTVQAIHFAENALSTTLPALGDIFASWECWRVVTHADLLNRCLQGLTRLARRIPLLNRGSWASEPDATARRVSERIRLLRPSWSQWAIILAVSTASWAFDFLSLTASAVALGDLVPWSALVVGFLVVQASIALQIMPGGAGLAEAGLLGVLVTSGTPIAQAMAIVLVYRAINWVGLAVLGWFVYAIQIHVSPQSG